MKEQERLSDARIEKMAATYGALMKAHLGGVWEAEMIKAGAAYLRRRQEEESGS